MDLFKDLDETTKELDLSQQHLTSVRGIEKLFNLKKLNLRGNLLRDCSFLNALPNLIDIDLSFNQIETIHFGGTLLNKINLEGNRLADIAFLRRLKNITKLNVRNNNISDLSPIQGHEQLTHLNIRENAIASLKPLATVHSLTNLNARDNYIRSIKPIIHLPLQERLYISGNDINDTHLLKSDIKKTDYTIQIPEPTFSRESSVNSPFELTINATNNCDIYYTLDGSNPTTKSNQYTNPVHISEDITTLQPVYANYETSPVKESFSFKGTDVKMAVVVKAIASRNGEVSKVNFATYILNPDLFAANSLPVISLSIDPKDLFDEVEGIYVPGAQYKEGDANTGNYYRRGRAFEKKIYLDFFDKNGELSLNQKLGVRINGSYTRRLPQKSLRLYARKKYGQSRISSTIFNDLPYDFKTLVLHNGGNDYYSTLIRDGLMHELIKDTCLDTQAYKPVVVLINGEYWGIHHLREKYNKHYLQAKYNVNEKNFALLKLSKSKGRNFIVEVGSEKDKQDYNDLVHFMENVTNVTEKEIQFIEQIIDIENFLTYVACQVYYGNTDSFSNNMMVWRKRTSFTPNAPVGHDGRFRWMLYDLDWGMGYRFDNSLHYTGDPVAFNMLAHVLSNKCEVSLFRNIMQHSSIKNQFKNILLTLLQNEFSTHHVTKNIDLLAEKIRPEVHRSVTRWENVASVAQWEMNINFLYEFAERRPEIVRKQLQDLV